MKWDAAANTGSTAVMISIDTPPWRTVSWGTKRPRMRMRATLADVRYSGGMEFRRPNRVGAAMSPACRAAAPIPRAHAALRPGRCSWRIARRPASAREITAPSRASTTATRDSSKSGQAGPDQGGGHGASSVTRGGWRTGLLMSARIRRQAVGASAMAVELRKNLISSLAADA